MYDKLMYTPDYEKQNYLIYRLNFWWENWRMFQLSRLYKSPKTLNHVCKTLGTCLIYSTRTTPFLGGCTFTLVKIIILASTTQHTIRQKCSEKKHEKGSKKKFANYFRLY